MESIVIAAALGAIAEIGDPSQIMLFVLSFRFRNDTVAVVAGMIVAMIIAHVPAGLAGAWFAASIDPAGLSWVVALMFFGMAALALPIDLSERRVVVRIDRVVLTVLATILFADRGSTVICSRRVAATARWNHYRGYCNQSAGRNSWATLGSKARFERH